MQLIGKEETIKTQTKNGSKTYTKTANIKQTEEIVNNKRMEMVIKELKKKKATGYDDITNEIIIESYQTLKEYIIRLMKTCIQYRI